MGTQEEAEKRLESSLGPAYASVVVGWGVEGTKKGGQMTCAWKRGCSLRNEVSSISRGVTLPTSWQLLLGAFKVIEAEP